MARFALPEPEDIMHWSTLPAFAVLGWKPDFTEFRDSFQKRAEVIVERAFGPWPRAPHGFYDSSGFIEGSRRRNAMKRAVAICKVRLIARAVARGELDVWPRPKGGCWWVKHPDDIWGVYVDGKLV